MIKSIWSLTVIATILFVFSFQEKSIAQSDPINKVGISLLGEPHDYTSGISPSIGIVWDRRINGKRGFETGIFFRSTIDRERLIFDSDHMNPIIYDVRKSYVTIPLLYKITTKHINISSGFTLEYYLGWKQAGGENIGQTRFSDFLFDTGPMIKLGRSISMGGNLEIEPEIRYGYKMIQSGGFYGVGLQIKNILSN